MDEKGTKVFDASYDVWGKQTVALNTIGLHRGYTGHEMLCEFDIINMNGRLYDPVLGRFFSPENYVQMPDNSQNFNRYSYCLNNPLKYADPSGNVFVLDDFIAITAMGAMMGAMNAAMSDKPIWKGALLGAASAAATYGIGQLFGVAGSFGHELLRAGAHGLSSGVFNALNGDNFWNGLISGAASSGIGSFAQSSNWNPYLLMASTTAAGGAIAWATGGDFLQGALNGLQIGAFNFAEHDGYDGNGGPGYVKRLSDGTLVAQEPLQEVVCIAASPRRSILFVKPSDAGKVSALSRSIIISAMAEAELTVVYVTSTVRSPEAQANAMFNNERRGKHIDYKQAGTEVQKYYPDKQKMIDKIYELGPYNVSHHCGTPETLKKINVIDISFQRVPIDKQTAFHNALSRRVTKLLDPFNSHDPAFHIEIKQY